MQTRDILQELRPAIPPPPPPPRALPETLAAPVQTPQNRELKFALHRKLLDRIDLQAVSSMPADLMRAEVRPVIARLIGEEKTPISITERETLIDEVLDEAFGLGPLEPLLRDRSVSDILVTTPSLVYVERAGKLERTNVQFRDNAHLLRIIEKVVSRVGRRIDESSPMVDARLPDGSRTECGNSTSWRWTVRCFPSAHRQRSIGTGRPDSHGRRHLGDDGVSQSLCARPVECDHRRRNGRRARLRC